MFSALRKVADFLWNGNPTHDDDSAYDDDPNVQSNHRRIFTGKVSHLYSGHGLVNGEIYFSYDVVLGGVRPSVGDIVQVETKQSHNDGGWRAVEVTVITQDWEIPNFEETICTGGLWEGSSVDPVNQEDDVVEEKVEGIIGKVSQISINAGIIDDFISFTFDSCLNGYIPEAGDWIKADATKTGFQFEDVSKIANITPLRTLDFEGSVTAIKEDHGFIDANASSSIFFYTNVCIGGHLPQRWDCVKGQAVESAQGQCVWRAVSVERVFNPSPFERIINPSSGVPVDKPYLDGLLRNNHGIYVSKDANFGNMSPGEVKVQSVWIQNNGTEPRSLIGCEVWGQSSLFSVQSVKFMFEHPHKVSTNEKRRNVDLLSNEKAVLYPAMGLYVNVSCTPRYLGVEYQLLVLQFEGFCIARRLSVTVHDPHQVHVDVVTDDRQGFRGSRVSNKPRNNRGSGWVVPGQRPSNRFRQMLPNRLPSFPVSEELEHCVHDNGDLLRICPDLTQELEMANYVQKFQTLLHLEEIQMDIDIREFDLERVSLRRVGEYLALAVPGLAEGRPSVMIGDKVTVAPPGEDNCLKYEGFVHEVLSEEILLKFHDSFHQKYNSEDYDVVFSFNRSTLRRCHQAAKMAKQLGESVLFPEKIHPKLPQYVPKYPRNSQPKPSGMMNGGPKTDVNYGKKEEKEMVYFNETLNERQREAVVRILLGQGRPTPYILFGPPGTGKTVTLVESILQIFLHCPHSRILACTPSNSAADLLAERLHLSGAMSTSDLVRVNALQRAEESVPECVRPYCYNNDSSYLVGQYRIIVCTCSSAGMLLSLGMRVGHITHVFVDEAGQATEPECLIPVSLIAGTQGQIVLAGDPYQLGPVLNSRLAKSHGLELSFLERLTQRPVYQRSQTLYGKEGGYNPLLVTKLIDNYRSHESLLSLPSGLFYHGELTVKADLSRTHPLTGWSHLPTVGFPFIFHGIRGEDLREGNSPSWFNPMETVQVVKYLQMLLKDECYNVLPEEIGVITAYRKQVEKIRLLIDKLAIPAIKVGSVEEFQGQERKVIIISTVRSTERLVGFDVRHHLGFLANPKRFNVSITRAQALLIVLGNPFVLAQDPFWRALIQYSSEKGGYIGCDLPDFNLYHQQDEQTENDD